MTTMQQNTSKTGSALRFAAMRFLAVTWGGFVAVSLYLFLVMMGPVLEGRWSPVIADYRIKDIRAEPNGGVSFVAQFKKVRDCNYYGVSWFVPDADGNLVRVQIAPLEGDPTAPQTGPMGNRAGRRQVIYPPPGATEIMAVMTHDCGMLWQTRTQLGPFRILKPDGTPVSRVVRRTSTNLALAGK